MGIQHIGFSIPQAIEWVLILSGVKRNVPDESRNEDVRRRYAAGEGLSEIAHDLGISPQRDYQILRGKNH